MNLSEEVGRVLRARDPDNGEVEAVAEIAQEIGSTKNVLSLFESDRVERQFAHRLVVRAEGSRTQ